MLPMSTSSCMRGIAMLVTFSPSVPCAPQTGVTILRRPITWVKLARQTGHLNMLLSFVEWLVPRGRILDRLAVLDSLQHPELLNLQNRGRFLILRGQAYADLGDLSQALT